MGWENIFHCEINGFCQKILKHYWPDATSYADITKTDFSIHRGQIDIVTGGFPCQPYSTAGNRKGKEDERHLWPEMLRAIREIQPGWIVGENVPGLLNWKRGMVLHEIKTDLEGEGFEVFPPCILPACSKDAPHRRDRVWIVAHSGGNERNGQREERQQCGERGEPCSIINGVSKQGIASNSPEFDDKKQTGEFKHEWENGQGRETNIRIEPSGYSNNATNANGGGYKTQRQGSILEQPEIEGAASRYTFSSHRNDWAIWPTQSPLCSRDDGLLTGLAGITVSKHRTESIKAYGNSIVPQVAYEIFKAIEQTNET